MFAAIGHSDLVRSAEAAGAVIAQAREGLGDREVAAVILTVGPEYDSQKVLDLVCDAFPGVPLIGGSVAGSFTSAEGFTGEGVVLTALSGVEASSGLGEGLSSDPAAAAGTAVEAALRCGFSPKVCIMVPEGIPVNGAAVAVAVNQALDGACPAVGASSGDHRGTQPALDPTVQFFGRRVLSDSIPVLLLGGDVEVGIGVACGWEVMGETRTITRASGTTVYEIDGMPAVDIYRAMFPDTDQSAWSAYPLAVLPDYPESTDFFVRAVFAANEDGSLTLGASVVEGAKVALADLGSGAVVEGTARAVTAARDRMSRDPKVVLLFSCAARQWMLGTKAHKDVAAAAGALSGAVQVSGYYGFGEYAPLGLNRRARFHQMTAAALLLG